ncbi:uncharacterized protein CCOS01_04454 [Colletotrichum costaricense]|uniref:Uncharacterized protein n=2 Tax=Colletotrichum acutatum species complex TaxID=2707335 RepID=A0AAI9Z2X3_9PEZI|nr:uncharacterized protein CCOS01_04454 [Colletotrichum costaricense]XP_060378777.1 uncharacterized protein CTAM01_10514 [Colletotrichum tamarilloi]KAI3538391.1 hypothetical protein CSPX01_09528 [Colletotrichum filicis]KAK1490804.1 hypothetical protein CTAM01_10514 [Colletotrichum tamarilloi]KAK1532471.1 hypothetical protein CCOS01_04454 [Colletotrichum costaricense]
MSRILRRHDQMRLSDMEAIIERGISFVTWRDRLARRGCQLNIVDRSHG